MKRLFLVVLVMLMVVGCDGGSIRGRPIEQERRSTEMSPTSTNDTTMVFVRGGAFTIGCAALALTDFCHDNEKPTHTVTVSNFHIGKYPVTQRLWVEVMGGNPSRFKGSDSPVERVSWDDVQAFIAKLNQMTGRQYRLPTEAEWEYAARGGTNTGGYAFSGSNDPHEVAWHGNASAGNPQPVGTKKPNELGIYDMSGNVWEWVNDWYGPYTADAKVDPEGSRPGKTPTRVLRGGSWARGAAHCFTSTRRSAPPNARELVGDGFGFRLALSDDMQDLQ